MNYYKTVYRNGERTWKPHVVSANAFNCFLRQVVEGLQNGEYYKMHTEKEGCDAVPVYFQINFTRDGARYVHIYEPHGDYDTSPSLFEDDDVLPDYMNMDI